MGQILISAANKSSGKTIVSTGLCAALHAQQKIVQPFKKGPDYIDPMWLSLASKRNCYNLDFWTQSHEEIIELFSHHSTQADISIIEANKGLYDGLDLHGSNSNAALAKLLGASVILVLDCRGTIRGIAPLLLGYQAFDPEVTIKGVILNFVGGPRHEAKLRKVVEHYTDLTVLGAIQRDAALSLEERHLGLIPSNELNQAHEKTQQLGELIAAQVDMKALLDCASPLPESTASIQSHSIKPNVKIAYAKDAAFGFYYADDLDTFKRLGAELIPFDTLQDQSLPQADGLFIGGGFPEHRLTALQANQSLRADILKKLQNGMPAYAECGGLMYLTKSIQHDGQQASMVGLIDANCVMTAKPQGRGYTQFTENEHLLWQKNKIQVINAHEFHHSRLDNIADNCLYSFDIQRGEGIVNKKDGISIHNTLASYAHQRHTQQNPWIARFLGFVRKISAHSAR
jgi:cobyrinic acid a,c-diamide synthase